MVSRLLIARSPRSCGRQSTAPRCGHTSCARRPSRRVRLACACLAVVWLSGCGAAGNKLALDKSVAHDSLIAFLDAWKKGGTPAELKSREPAIIVNDPDWAAGRKLLEYRLLGSENDDGSNLHAAAELSLQAPRGVVKQQVTYIVGTSPVITIVPQSTVN